MNNENKGQAEQLQAFYKLWSEIFEKAAPAESGWSADWVDVWRVGEAEGASQPNDTAQSVRASLAAAGEFYARFVEQLGKASASEDSRLFMELPRQLFEQHLKSVGINADNWGSWVEVMRQRPGLAEEISSTLNELQMAVAQHLLGFSRVGKSASESFGAQQEGEAPSEAFKRWMDGFDTAYQAFIRSPDFPANFARVVNNAAALNQQVKILMKPWCELNGLPDPEKWGELQNRVRDIQDENKRLREELEMLKKSACGQEAPAT